MSNRYRVETRVGLQRLGPQGEWTNDRLSFEDVTDLGPLDFGQISQLLLRFHEVAQGFAASLAPAPGSESAG